MLNSESFESDLLIRSNSDTLSGVSNSSVEYYEVANAVALLAYEPITKYENNIFSIYFNISN